MKYLIFIFVYFLIIRSSWADNDEDDDDDDDEDCIFNVYQDMAAIEPLLMTANSPAKFIYPKVTNPTTIQIDEEDHVRLVCNDYSMFVTCRNKLFWVDGTNTRFKMKRFRCANEDYSHFIRPVNSGCPSNVLCFEIGFQINVIDFIPTIDLILFNPGRKRPLWAHTKLISIIGYRQIRGETNEYKKDIMFDKMSTDMNEVFHRDYQKRRFTKILKDRRLAEKYINDEVYLKKGQLIDNDDFFYKPQQDTVHYYANVMPIWSSIIDVNWFGGGFLARKLAGDLRSDMDLWSGSIGTLELEDDRGIKREIYLATEDGKDVVPVPKILFKYFYEPKSNRGIAILVVNNPFLTRLPSDYRLCEEMVVCPTIWPIMRNFTLGYTYCCTVQDFAPIAKRRGLPTFPEARQLL